MYLLITWNTSVKIIKLSTSVEHYIGYRNKGNEMKLLQGVMFIIFVVVSGEFYLILTRLKC